MNNILDILNIPFGYLLEFIYTVIPNYALTLLIFAILVKIILLPLGIKQQKNMVKQASLRPKEMAIRKKYAGRTDQATQQKLQQEIMDFYKKENYSPFGGCLPMLIQFPIIISLYNVIRNPLTYLCHLTANEVSIVQNRITELFGGTYASELELVNYLRSGSLDHFLPEGINLDKLPSFEMFGGLINLGDIPSFTFDWLLLVPVITFVAVFGSMKLTRKFTYQPPQDEGGSNAAASNKIMEMTMPLFSVWLTFTVPAILGVYWIYQNVLGLVQQIILAKLYPIPHFTDEEIAEIERTMTGKSSKKKKPSADDEEVKPASDKPRVRSLHHIDDDDYIQPPKEEPKRPQLTPEQEAEKPGLKEDRKPTKSEKASGKQADSGDKPKPRSLHRIDEE